VAAVFDSVGATTFEAGMQALARDETMVCFGNTSGNVPPFSLATLLPKNLRLMRPSVFGYLQTRDDFVGYAKELFDFILRNKFDGIVHEVYHLEEVVRAHADLEGRKTAGKLLLIM
jgi:NADPH2:quinone reductase